MKYMFWGFALIMAGIFGIVFIVMFESITINNESEYYVLKEAMEASMLESVDVTCYRNNTVDGCGETIKISEQKFVENFTRRFVATVSGDASQYEIEFYDIIESPPKATVVIRSKTQNYSIMAEDDDGSFDIVNSLDGILVYEEVDSKDEVSPDTDSVLEVYDPEIKVEDILEKSNEAVDNAVVVN